MVVPEYLIGRCDAWLAPRIRCGLLTLLTEPVCSLGVDGYRRNTSG